MQLIPSNELLELFWNSPNDFYFKAMPFKNQNFFLQGRLVSFWNYKIKRGGHFVNCSLDLFPLMQKTYSQSRFIRKEFLTERTYYLYDSKEEMLRDKALTII